MSFKSWDTNKMHEQLNYLRSLPEDKKTPQSLQDIEYLEDLLSIGDDDIVVFESPLTFQEQLIDDMYAINSYIEFITDVKLFSQNASLFHGFDPGEISIVQNITPKKIFGFLRDFFHQFDEEFARVFDYVYRERFHNIKFSDNRPISYHLASLSYSYLNLSREKTIEDFLNAAHEYTHAIVDYMCYHDGTLDYPFSELISLFIEFVAADYIKEVFDKVDRDVNTLQLSSCKNLVVYAENISIQHDYFLTRDEISDWKKVVQGMQEMSNKSKRYIKNLLQKSAHEKLSYTVPYITAIELYYMYLEDKKACIDLVKYLIRLEAAQSYRQELQDNGISLNKHSADWVDTLMQRKK